MMMMLEPQKMAKSIMMGMGPDASPENGGMMQEAPEVDSEMEDGCMGIAEDLIEGVKKGDVEMVAYALKMLKFVLRDSSTTVNIG